MFTPFYRTIGEASEPLPCVYEVRSHEPFTPDMQCVHSTTHLALSAPGGVVAICPSCMAHHTRCRWDEEADDWADDIKAGQVFLEYDAGIECGETVWVEVRSGVTRAGWNRYGEALLALRVLSHLQPGRYRLVARDGGDPCVLLEGEVVAVK